MKFIIRPFVLLLFVPLLFVRCDDSSDNTYSYDSSLISMVITDNVNLSLLNTANKRTGIYDLLLTEGPFTLLAPSDEAFNLSGYKTSREINKVGQTKLTQIMNYHVLKGYYEFDKLPFRFNHEISSFSGGKLFVTRWVKDTDTLVLINGVVVTPVLKDASNGKIQIINRLLEPYLFDYLSEALANEPELTLFSQAVQRSKELLRSLSSEGAFTVYAPNNEAMIAYGLTSLEVINETKIEELEKLLRYHIVPDFRFVYDYFLTTQDDATIETMLNGENITVNFIPNKKIPGTYTGIALQGTRNTTDAKLVRENILSGNGVLHIIDQVLLN